MKQKKQSLNLQELVTTTQQLAHVCIYTHIYA